MTLTELEAAAIAEKFGRASVDKWEEWGCEISLSNRFGAPGNFVFIYPARGRDENGRRYRIGGNIPILVDMETGRCRFEQPSWKC